MARLAANNPFNKLSGQLGKQIVFKQYGDKTVVSAYPDMSKVKPSKKRKANRGAFADAVAYAKKVAHDPELKQKYLKNVKKGESVYHYALKEWFRRESK